MVERRAVSRAIAGVLLGALLATILGAPAVFAVELTSTSLPITVVYGSADQQELAQRALLAAEHAWTRQVLELGYPPPWTGSSPSTLREGMEIHLVNTGLGAGGAIIERQSDVPATPQTDCSSRISLDDATGPSSPLVDEGIFHELHHAMEYAIDCVEAMSAYEGFTMAQVATELPESQLVVGTMSIFQAFPEYAVDFWTMHMPCDGEIPCFPYQLGASLFPLYLVDRFAPGDPRALGDIWRGFAQPGTVRFAPMAAADVPNAPDWFDGVDAWLAERGSSLDEAFAEFSAWRAIVGAHDDGAHYEDGSRYPEPRVSGTLELREGTSVRGATYEYGSSYVEALGMDGAEPQPHHLQVQGDPDAAWSASALLWRAAQPVERVPFVFDGAAGSVTLEPEAALDRVLLVVSQHKDATHLPDAMDYDNLRDFTLSVTVGDAAATDRDLDAGQGGPASTGCAAAPGGALLLAAVVPLLRRGRRTEARRRELNHPRTRAAPEEVRGDPRRPRC